MFDDLVECSPLGSKKTKTGLTVFISTMVQVMLLGIMVLIPLIYTEALPKAMLNTFLVAPPPPPPPPPPAAPIQRIIKPVVRLMQSGKLQAPTSIPKQVTMIKEEEMPPDMAAGVVGGVPGGIPGGQSGGVLGGIIGGVAGSNLPPPPKVTPSRIRQGGNVTQAKLINMVKPQYPTLARQARVQGTVRLHAIIAKDGTVMQLEVLPGAHPLLIQAAIDAVRQWRYQPTLLNGEPVEVDTTIDVIFTIGG
jgi:protein TonB